MSLSVVNELITCNVGIKQEDTKKDNSLLQQDGGFNGKDYYYCCDRCSQTSPNLKSVMEHRASVHNVKSGKGSMVKDINVEPDVHDPNFYCKSCKVSYTNKRRYRHHLKAVHYMVLKTMRLGKIPQNTNTPDPDDPNLYCRGCDYTYAEKRQYKRHCRYTHGVTSVKFAGRTFTQDGIIDTYCKPCDMRLSSMQSYKKHIFAIHKSDWRPMYQKPKNIAPDVDDPNFYCCACEMKLTSKRNFRFHLMRVHSIYQSAFKKPSLEPDIDDPNFYCRACQKNHPSRSKYRAHLRYVHQLALLPVKRNASPEKLPNPNDPHNFCSVCKESWKKRTQYRRHCMHVHFMALDHYSIFNPNAMIDINHPTLYCAQCERSYSTKLSFRTHLWRIHNI
ncbi:hypothetical protein PS6_008338 [Mucor atramentarius]